MNSKILSAIIVLMMCAPVFAAVDVQAVPEDPSVDGTEEDPGEYVAGVILVKDRDFSAERLNVPYESVRPIYPGSIWYEVELGAGVGTLAALDSVLASGRFEDASLNHVYQVEAVDVSGNPMVGDSTYLDSMGIRDAWDMLEKKGVSPGGDRSVVIGILDSGVDYEHEDLKDNIWVNEDEIPGNGIDDDGNGYVDDIHGWDFWNHDSDPMDDNGHGSHVAGISAAVNNDKGTVGVAFNCRIMCLKSSSEVGKFTDTASVEGLRYAADNGASVVNMSFEGFNAKGPLQDTIDEVSDRCVVVAAAGNDACCNNKDHEGMHMTTQAYPGSHPGAIGVMSTEKDGRTVSSFSNYDDTPYDSVEYDVYAAGTGIFSTYKEGGYRTLNGTSMATPVVAGIAALLLSSETDRSVLTTDMVRAAIVNSGSVHPYNEILDARDMDHAFCDAADALRILESGRRPFVNAMSPQMSEPSDLPANNGNGEAEAGETVIIGFDVMNRGFTTPCVTMRMETDDPYLDQTLAIWGYGTIGDYEIRPCTMSTGDDRFGCFAVRISPDCPHGHMAEYRVIVEYEDPATGNMMTTYRDCSFTVSRYQTLPSEITEDTVFDKGFSYVMDGDLVIAEGAAAVFGPGCTVKCSVPADITVNGKLLFEGDMDDRAELIGDRSIGSVVRGSPDAEIRLTCTDIRNLVFTGDMVGAEDLMGFSRCSVECIQNMMDGVAGTLVNFDDSVLKCDNGGLTVMGAQRSLFRLSGMLSPLDFCALPVSDCVLIANIDEFSDPVRFLSDTDGVLIADTMDVVYEMPVFEKGEENTVSNICFERSYSECEDLPSVPFSQLDTSRMWPMVVGCELIDADGNVAEIVLNKEYTIRLHMSCDMSQDAELDVGRADSMHAARPIEGGFVSERIWEGTLDLSDLDIETTITVNVKGGSAVSDSFKSAVPTDGTLYFDNKLDTDAVLSAVPAADGHGVEFGFDHPHYVQCTGKNVYRLDTYDGMTKLNSEPLPADADSFHDATALPGRTYMYTVSLVDTNGEELPLQEPVSITVPSLVHTPHPVQFSGSDVILECAVIGDFLDGSVSLSYMTDDGWMTVQMERDGDVYRAAIPAEHVAAGDLKYRLEAEGTDLSGELPCKVLLGSEDDPLITQVDDRGTVVPAVSAVMLALLSLVLIAAFRRR